jgi:hypothetical protein
MLNASGVNAMRKVFPSAMVAHIWAQQSQPEARNAQGNFYFHDATIFSYGSHFPIARFITRKGKGRAVLFTTRSYSVTTSRHLSRTRRAIPGGVPVFYVANLDAPSVSAHAENRADYVARLTAATDAAARSRNYFDQCAETARELAEAANAYAAFFGLRWRLKAPEFSPEFIAAARKRAADAAAKRRIADAARSAAYAAHSAAYAAQLAEYDRVAALTAAERIAEWRAGTAHNLPWDSRTLNDGALLRVYGDEVQTSLGARFPVADALRAGRLIAKVRSIGAGWQADPALPVNVGAFTLDSIAANGDIVAGCHNIKWDEIAAALAVLESRAAAALAA